MTLLMKDIGKPLAFINTQLATESCFCLVSMAPARSFSIVLVIGNDEHMSMVYETAIKSLLLIGQKAEV